MSTGSDRQPLARMVLAPLAFSPRAAAVACEARRWAAVLGAKLVLLHVGPDEANTRRKLDERLKGHGLADAQVEIRSGRPGAAIVKAAAELGADLIVAGALETEGALGYYVGSVARRIARRADCPVLLLTEPRVDAPLPGRWAVSVPHEPSSPAMLGFVSKLAAVVGPGRIDLIGEYDLSGAGLALEGEMDQRAAESQRQRIHQMELGKLAEMAAGVSFGAVTPRLVCLRGRVGHESAQYARREQADLLIAPAPARLGFWDKFIQHGVEFALQSLPCALWLHRPPEGR